jgi:BlaI family penicillinase repressor
MSLIYEAGEVTAAQTCDLLGQELSNSAVRTFLRILETKGHLCHREEGGKYYYRPVASPVKVRRQALHQVLKTFFGGSLANAAQMLVEGGSRELSEMEIDRLEALIHAARERRKAAPSSKSKRSPS